MNRNSIKYKPINSTVCSFTATSYKFSFNGKEKDPEGMGGGSATYDYGFRIYNPQIAKFLSTDPLSKSYPWYTPYQYAGNKPIAAIDLDGLEEFIVVREYSNGVVTSTTRFVPENQRQIIGRVNGEVVRRMTGVDYRFYNRDNSFTTVQYGDFIQGSKESNHRNNRLPYYLNNEDCLNNVNIQYAPLGVNNQVLAQGKPYEYDAEIDRYRIHDGQLETYNTPIVQEFYATNSSSVSVSQALNASDLADYLIANPNFTANIDAHTDRVGSPESNQTLSNNRANGIRQAIINSAVSSGKYSTAQINDLSSRITATGFGENRAAAQGATDEVENQADRTTEVTINRP